MNKTWTFVGGMLAGVVSVFAAAAVAVKLDSQNAVKAVLREERKKSWPRQKEM